MNKSAEESPPEIDSLSFLAETAVKFSSGDIGHTIYNYIGESLNKLNPASTVFVSSIDLEKRILTLETIINPEKKLQKVASLLGYNPVGKVLDIDNTILDLNSGMVSKFEKGIYGLSFGNIPLPVSRAIEKLLNIGDIFGIAFLIEKRIYGNAVIILPKGIKLFHKDIIETFARQVSIILKRIEAEKNENRYRTLLEFMSPCAFYQNAEGDYIDVNEATLNQLDLNRDEFLNLNYHKPQWQFVDEFKRPLSFDETPSQIALKTGKPVKNMIIGIDNPTKKKFSWFIANAIPEFDRESTTPYRVFVTLQDITQQRIAEEQLRNSEIKSRALLNAIPDMMFRMNRKGVFLDYKSDISHLYYQKENIIGKYIHDITPPEFADLTEIKIRHTLETGKIDEFEYQLEIPDIGLQDYETRMVPAGKDEVIAIVRNITDKKKTERLLIESEANARAIMESTSNIIILIDRNFCVIENNEAHAKRLGFTRTDLIGKTLTDFLPPEVAERRKQAINEVFSSGLPKTLEDLRGQYWNEVSIYPVKNMNGIIDRLAIFAQDITQRKKDQDALKRSEAALKEMNATKDKFFSIIAHDLRSPFNSILGFSEILKDDAKNLDIHEIEYQASLIHSATHHTLQLLDNLLNWALMQQGNLPFKPRNILLYELINEVNGVISDSANKKSIKLNNLIHKKQIVVADEDMIKTIMRNLLSNAVKFTYPGGLIEISATATSDEIQISVSDNGAGIPEENIDKLFNIGSSLSTRGTYNEKGTGLGLILCKDFVEKHDGKIWATSEPGKGSTFSFSFPQFTLDQ